MDGKTPSLNVLQRHFWASWNNSGSRKHNFQQSQCDHDICFWCKVEQMHEQLCKHSKNVIKICIAREIRNRFRLSVFHSTFHGLKSANWRGSDFITVIQTFNTMVPKKYQTCQKRLRFKSQPKDSSESLWGPSTLLLADLKKCFPTPEVPLRSFFVHCMMKMTNPHFSLRYGFFFFYRRYGNKH